MVKTLRILSFVFMAICLAAVIYGLLPGKQLAAPFIMTPMLISMACSMQYHRMAHPEKVQKLTSKSSLVIMLTVFVLTVAVTMVIIAL